MRVSSKKQSRVLPGITYSEDKTASHCVHDDAHIGYDVSRGGRRRRFDRDGISSRLSLVPVD